MILAISNFFRDSWLLLVVGLIIAFVIYKIWAKTPNGKYINDQIILKLPIV